MSRGKQSILQKIRDGPVGQSADAVIEGVDQFLGPSGKAWVANGLEELRQAVALGTEQIHGGNNPGLWGTITTGEATAERLAGESFDVPVKMSLDELRGYARERNQADEQAKGPDRSRDDGRGMEI